MLACSCVLPDSGEIRASKAAAAQLAQRSRKKKRSSAAGLSVSDDHLKKSDSSIIEDEPIIIAPTTSFALRLGQLYEAYRVDMYFWQSVILFRRAMFAILDVA